MTGEADLAHDYPATHGEVAGVNPCVGEDTWNRLWSLQRKYAVTAADDPARERLRDRLVIGYLPLARHIARRYQNRGEPLDDLEQVAAVGLLNAIERFDPDQGHHFLAFAVPTITGEIRRHFRDKTWAMRMPRRLKDLHVSIGSVAAELTQQLGRAPRPSEIANRLGVSTDEVVEGLLAAQAYRAHSLDQIFTDTGGPTASHNTLTSVLGREDHRLEQIVKSRSLNPHLAALPERERDILIMRFYRDMTQSQIAQRIGLSQMHVSRLLSETLAHLRDAVDQDRPPSPDTPHQIREHTA